MEIFSAEGFRKRLAGIVEKSSQLGTAESQSVMDECVFLLSQIPNVYSDDLDRKNLWERIASGVEVSIAKCGGDIETFVNYLLEHVKAQPSRVAALDSLSNFLAMLQTRPKEWKETFLNTMSKKKFVIVVFARERWNLNKGNV